MLGGSSIQSTNEIQRPVRLDRPSLAEQQQTTNSKTGKIERVFVNLEAVYPNPDDPTGELSFEELRAQSRGWLDIDWAAEKEQARHQEHLNNESKAKSISLDTQTPNASITDDSQQEVSSQNTTEQLGQTAPAEDMTQGTKARKSKRTKVMEVKAETQTSMG